MQNAKFSQFHGIVSSNETHTDKLQSGLPWSNTDSHQGIDGFRPKYNFEYHSFGPATLIFRRHIHENAASKSSHGERNARIESPWQTCILFEANIVRILVWKLFIKSNLIGPEKIIGQIFRVEILRFDIFIKLNSRWMNKSVDNKSSICLPKINSCVCVQSARTCAHPKWYEQNEYEFVRNGSNLVDRLRKHLFRVRSKTRDYHFSLPFEWITWCV